MNEEDEKGVLYCSFCGATSNELVIATNAIICGECVDICTKLVQDYRARSSTTTTEEDK